MFYIISTRIPLVYSDTTNRKFLKIFILGSLIYICVHYYLHLEERNDLMNKLKSKILYVMGADFLIACALAKFLAPTVVAEKDDKEDEDKPSYTADEKTRMMRELEERRRAEAQKMMMHQQQMQYAQAAQMQAQMQTQRLQEVPPTQTAQTRLKKKDVVKDYSTTSSSSSSSSTSSSSSSSESSDKKKKSKEKSKKTEKKEEDKKVVEKKEEKKPSKSDKVSKSSDKVDTDTDMPIYE